MTMAPSVPPSSMMGEQAWRYLRGGDCYKEETVAVLTAHLGVLRLARVSQLSLWGEVRLRLSVLARIVFQE